MPTIHTKNDILERIQAGESGSALSRLYGIDTSIISKWRNGKPIRFALRANETPHERLVRLVLRRVRYLGSRRLKRVK